MASDDVTRRLDEVRWSTVSLLDALRERPPTDGWARQPSLLPGWTRGHVLSHLARNADAMVRALAGAARGDRIPMYDGEDARAAEIQAGAGRPAAELAADVTESADRLEDTWSRLDRRGLAARGGDPRRPGAGAAADRDALARGGDPPRRPRRRVRAGRLAGVLRRPAAALAAGPGAGSGPRLPSGLTVEVVNTDSGQRWLVGEDVPPPVGTARSARAAAVRSAAPPPVRVVGPSWALVGWLLGRPSVARPELGELPALGPWS